MERSDYKTYPPTDDCKRCGGKCCKKMGCSYAPTDFEDLTFDGLKREIEKGKTSIDWWEGEPERAFYLRARHVGEPIVCGSWGGRCVNLTEHGCSLLWEDRPLEGRSLKPGGDGESCVPGYTKENAKNEWKDYSEVLGELFDYFGGEEDDLWDTIINLLGRFHI